MNLQVCVDFMSYSQEVHVINQNSWADVKVSTRQNRSLPWISTEWSCLHNDKFLLNQKINSGTHIVILWVLLHLCRDYNAFHMNNLKCSIGPFQKHMSFAM